LAAQQKNLGFSIHHNKLKKCQEAEQTFTELSIFIKESLFVAFGFLIRGDTCSTSSLARFVGVSDSHSESDILFLKVYMLKRESYPLA
jgi:hypothetical protein